MTSARGVRGQVHTAGGHLTGPAAIAATARFPLATSRFTGPNPLYTRAFGAFVAVALSDNGNIPDVEMSWTLDQVR